VDVPLVILDLCFKGTIRRKGVEKNKKRERERERKKEESV